jgi:hypothetical protein
MRPLDKVTWHVQCLALPPSLAPASEKVEMGLPPNSCCGASGVPLRHCDCWGHHALGTVSAGAGLGLFPLLVPGSSGNMHCWHCSLAVAAFIVRAVLLLVVEVERHLL